MNFSGCPALRATLAAFAVAILLLTHAPASAAGRPTLLSSVNSEGEPGDGDSGSISVAPAISSDGRFVAFASSAENLLAGDTNNAADVFVRDLWTDELNLVSTPDFIRRKIMFQCEVICLGLEVGNGHSVDPAISRDGRFIAYSSVATNLILAGGPDLNMASDVFVADAVLGVTELASVSTAGSRGNGGSGHVSISGDGRFVAFESDATNLVSDDTNGARDVFVRDRMTKVTLRVSSDSLGVLADGASRAASISSGGRVVAFESDAPNLVPGDTNGATDVFVRDLATGTTVRASVSATGAQATGGSTSPAVSGDGSTVVFASDATDLTGGDTNGVADVFVRALGGGPIMRIVAPGGAQLDGESGHPDISSDGSRVTFESLASNLVPGDTIGSRDVFLLDRLTGALRMVSVDSVGTRGNGPSYAPGISGDGHSVTFTSDAFNLVAGDENAKRDVFVNLDETVCPDRAPPSGPVSGPLHGAEDPLPGGIERAAYAVNCSVLVPAGL